MKFLLANDGVDHINIYSQAKTVLGRFLSNWTLQPFTCEDGKFDSIEGYWFWLGTRDERFRSLYGYAAKRLGGSLPRTVRLAEEEFQRKIKLAMEIKIRGAPDFIRRSFKDSTLPFDHYYVYNGVRKDAGYTWIVEYWEKLRKEV